MKDVAPRGPRISLRHRPAADAISSGVGGQLAAAPSCRRLALIKRSVQRPIASGAPSKAAVASNGLDGILPADASFELGCTTAPSVYKNHRLHRLALSD